MEGFAFSWLESNPALVDFHRQKCLEMPGNAGVSLFSGLLGLEIGRLCADAFARVRIVV